TRVMIEWPYVRVSGTRKTTLVFRSLMDYVISYVSTLVSVIHGANASGDSYRCPHTYCLEGLSLSIPAYGDTDYSQELYVIRTIVADRLVSYLVIRSPVVIL
ncbi:hypothetical protein HAX54_038878, partial [Datura stramonium]|nr:hypothetical protein [Datura stramonium]